MRNFAVGCGDAARVSEQGRSDARGRRHRLIRGVQRLVRMRGGTRCSTPSHWCGRRSPLTRTPRRTCRPGRPAARRWSSCTGGPGSGAPAARGTVKSWVFSGRAPPGSARVCGAAPASSVNALFGRGAPAVPTRPAPTAMITANGGWFGGADSAPDLPLDTAVLTPGDQAELTVSLARNGFHGPTGYYLNHRANAGYAGQALHRGTLDLPVLFIGAAYDPVP